MGLLTERSEEDDDQGPITIAGLEHLGGDAPDEIVFELDEWSERDRTALRDRLETLGVPHHWEVTTLVVAETDEAWVERVMDQVEEALGAALDPEVVQVAYDLTDWDAGHRNDLMAALDGDAVPHSIEGDELFVHEIDEQRVDEIIDGIISPGGASTALRAAGPETMGEIFVAADRLSHDPADREGALSLLAALRSVEGTAPPYGMDKVWWDNVVGQVGQLVRQLDALDAAGDAELDQAADGAVAVRDALRPYV